MPCFSTKDPLWRECLMTVGGRLIELSEAAAAKAFDVAFWLLRRLVWRRPQHVWDIGQALTAAGAVYEVVVWLPGHLGNLLFTLGFNGSAFEVEMACDYADDPDADLNHLTDRQRRIVAEIRDWHIGAMPSSPTKGG